MSQQDPDPSRPLFSVHVMKTGGSTLRVQMARTWGRSAFYPLAHGKDVERKLSVDRLRDELGTVEPPGPYRVYHAHLPFAAAQLVPFEVTTMVVVRDPVDRAVSHLRQVAGRLELAPDAVYELPWFRDRLFVDHQVRALGLAVDELDDWRGVGDVLMSARMLVASPPAQTAPPIRLGPEHLARAKAAVEGVDLLGTTDRLAELVEVLARDRGLRTVEGEAHNVGAGPEVSDDLRARIAADNELDRALYDHAVEVLAARLA